jgi:hypothetical protein
MNFQELVEMHESILGLKSDAEIEQRAANVLAKYQYHYDELNKIEQFLHEKAQEHHYYTHPDTKSGRAKQIIYYFRDIATRHLTTVKQFRDETVIWMKALELIAEMVSNASSHAEKNARLRGMSELIQEYIQKAMKADFDFGHSYYWWPDNGLFKGDSPTRDLMRRIHELERENKRLSGETSEVSGEPEF